MKIPLYAGLWWIRSVGGGCLFALCWFVSSCVIEPLPNLRCYPCKTTCIEEQKLICVQGVCVPEANPDPKQCSDEKAEGGSEKAEIPEETTQPEEPFSPEDGAPIDGEALHELEPERPEAPDTQDVVITQIEGDDTQAQGISYPIGISAPPNAKQATLRFRTSWRVFGANLRRIDSWQLQSKDTPQTFTLTATDIKDTEMKLTLSAALTVGFFTLIGLVANIPTVQAEVFVLQGKDGAQGPKGDAGDTKFSDNDAAALKALLSKLQANGDNLDITANTVSFKPASAPKITLDLGSTATIKAGNATLDFSGDTITAKSTAFSVETTTFEVKGANATALKLDDAARSIALRVTQKNATTQATFSLEGGDANTNPAPATKYPLAIFNRTNVQLQNGAGKTDATINGLGNLIVGYNSKANQPTAKRTGSHNFVVGDDHDYQNYGGFVSGSQNTLLGGFSTVAGGSGNSATGSNSTVAGGSGNSATGSNSTVAGGSGNEAGRENSSICSSVNTKVRATDPVNDPIRYCCGQP